MRLSRSELAAAREFDEPSGYVINSRNIRRQAGCFTAANIEMHYEISDTEARMHSSALSIFHEGVDKNW